MPLQAHRSQGRTKKDDDKRCFRERGKRRVIYGAARSAPRSVRKASPGKSSAGSGYPKAPGGESPDSYTTSGGEGGFPPFGQNQEINVGGGDLKKAEEG